MREDKYALISADQRICHGKPCVRGTRILVSGILSQLAAGYDFARIRDGYPGITDDPIRAAIDYAQADARRRAAPGGHRE